MDGRSGRFLRSTQRQPALQLRPQPRFIVPPAAPGGAINVVQPFVRPIPKPIPAVQALPTTVLPRLGLAGLAFGLGFFVGDALINPILGQKSVFDWGVFNSPDGAPQWGTQEPLPDTMQVTTTGEMGSDGADISASVTYGDSRAEGNDGCTSPIDRDISQGSSKYARAGYGQLRYFQGKPGANNCGALSYGVEALLNVGSSSGNETWETIRSINAGIWNPEGGITYANFQLEYVPRGEPLGFVPDPIWEPAVEPRQAPEPLPEIAPLPEPRVKPLAPPLVPQAPPTVRPIPAPTPVPGPNPAPAPVPAPLPSTVPNPRPTPPPTIPDTLTTPINNQGNIVPRPNLLPQTTPTNQHFPVSGGEPVTNGGTRPTLNAIAAEVGRIEQKVARNMQNTADIPWWLIPTILELLSAFLETDIPGTTYSLTGVCESVGDEGRQPTAEFPVAPAPNLYAIINRWDVMDDMLQQHLAWRTPICDEKPELEGDMRTISFISDETSPFGKSRLRKRLRYRSVSGIGRDELVQHWANFTWQAGPVCVKHTGTSWGNPQVWAASIDEGKRVLRHAAGESGVDPDKNGRWLVGGSDSSRIGVSGTMRVWINKGTYCITARDGSDGLPEVRRV